VTVTLIICICSFPSRDTIFASDAEQGERGGLPPTLSKDGVHPLPAGYAIMAPLAEAGIENALK
jgi:lysophospholipase L1-like esterase